MNLRFFLVVICLLIFGYANDVQAQDSLVYKVPNLNTFKSKAKNVVSFIAKPFTFLQKDSIRKKSTNKSKADLKKLVIHRNQQNRYKLVATIQLKFHYLNSSQYIFRKSFFGKNQVVKKRYLSTKLSS